MKLRSIKSLQEYKDIFVNCMGFWDENQTPGKIWILEDEEPIGFFSGYMRSKKEFYLQYVGVMPGECNKKGVATMVSMVSLFEHLAKTGVRFVQGIVENTNIRLLKAMFIYGFLIIGTTTDSNGTVWINLLKDLSKDKK